MTGGGTPDNQSRHSPKALQQSKWINYKIFQPLYSKGSFADIAVWRLLGRRGGQTLPTCGGCGD